MQASARAVAARGGILAAVFVFTLSGMLIGLHEASAPAPSAETADLPKPPIFRRLPTDGSPGKTTRAHVTAAREKAKNYRPDQHDQVRKQLRPALVTVQSPVAVQLGGTGRIKLKIENDPAGAGKNARSGPGDQIDPVRTSVVNGENVAVYQMQVSNRVTTHLFEAAGEHPIGAREADTLPVPSDGVAWTWNVPASQVGRKTLEFVMLAHVDAAPDPYPVGNLALEMPVEVNGLQWVKYYLSEVGTFWNWLVALATSLVAVTTAVPLVIKWLPSRRRDSSAEPQKVT